MGIKYTAEGSRLENFCPVKYTNPKILTGNWFEEKCAYKKNRYRHSSEYQNEFKPKPLTTYPKSIIWDAKFSSDFDTTNTCQRKVRAVFQAFWYRSSQNRQV
ncbi:unnamed protein product [Acanthoscelides obtectus]|uniref:Uncharacterized protein n=1 Tax=Acanthoscelides obtectus TaxID=200917 RepID=A0A9P0KMY7_ACAOB|nr:unnamed protein product [Acanthoscelides obtectus]CAK1620996.1 hypothetical protein AOBTE_LOCUS692 [Acanthoscelides obtectus]